MKSFAAYLREIYDEPDDSTFTSDGITYDLNKILLATIGWQTQDFEVDKLTWVFEYDNPWDNGSELSRILNADLNTPILVEISGNQLVVLDGLHRLAKAVQLRQTLIKGILLTDDFLSHFAISTK